MAHTNTWAWIAGLLTTLVGSTAIAQQLEYVTRNVEPTHVVRFGSQPIRITITDRGIRQPLASAPVTTKRFKHRGFRTFPFRGHRIGGGLIVVRDTTNDTSHRDEPRSRTVYGRGHPRHPDAKKDTDARLPNSEANERHLRRVFSLIQARNRGIAAKERGASADDR